MTINSHFKVLEKVKLGKMTIVYNLNLIKLIAYANGMVSIAFGKRTDEHGDGYGSVSSHRSVSDGPNVPNLLKISLINRSALA